MYICLIINLNFLQFLVVICRLISFRGQPGRVLHRVLHPSFWIYYLSYVDPDQSTISSLLPFDHFIPPVSVAEVIFFSNKRTLD